MRSKIPLPKHEKWPCCLLSESPLHTCQTQGPKDMLPFHQLQTTMPAMLRRQFSSQFAKTTICALKVNDFWTDLKTKFGLHTKWGVVTLYSLRKIALIETLENVSDQYYYTEWRVILLEYNSQWITSIPELLMKLIPDHTSLHTILSRVFA